MWLSCLFVFEPTQYEFQGIVYTGFRGFNVKEVGFSDGCCVSGTDMEHIQEERRLGTCKEEELRVRCHSWLQMEPPGGMV